GELEDLHRAGALHLDIKPANVMLDRAASENFVYSWRPVLSDYGLSVFQRGPATIAPGGTPAFMAPEQALRQPVDRRADLWGLGGTLFFLLTGPPPTGALVANKQRTGAAVVPSVVALAPECPRWIADIVDRCLRLNPEDRPKSAEEVFDTFLKHVAITTDY